MIICAGFLVLIGYGSWVLYHDFLEHRQVEKQLREAEILAQARTIVYNLKKRKGAKQQ